MGQTGVAMYLRKHTGGDLQTAPISIAIRDESITVHALDIVNGEEVAQVAITIEGNHIVIKAMQEPKGGELTTDVQPVIIQLCEIEQVPF